MGDQRKIKDYPKVLAVEGYSDRTFYIEVLEYLSKDAEVFIKHFNGAEDLLLQLEVLITPELLAEKEAIGVILDADADADATKQSIAHKMQKITGVALQHGVWSVGSPRLGFFVAPDGNGPGEVETLVWNAWANDPTNSAATQCVEGYLTCMDAVGHSAHSPDKGRISALLAVLNDEDPRLGPGARADKFSFDRPEFDPLVNFLKGL